MNKIGKLNKTYLKVKFDCNSFVINLLRIIGVNFDIITRCKLQTFRGRIPKFGQLHIKGGLLGGPIILSRLVSIEL